jgi:SAM-dependent methyltransferase
MFHFTCNICGRANATATLPWEPSTCEGCGSNIRFRALNYLLSKELFGVGVCLQDFPKLHAIRGMGFSDDERYAPALAEKFDYTNTFFHKEPRIDITEQHPDLWGTFDFILSSDVFEHINAPVERAFEEAFRLLKPNGFLCVTVPSSVEDRTDEHYPGLSAYAVASLGGELVLVTRDEEGQLQLHQKPVFHGGPGQTLEMRVFAQNDLARKLKASGFSSVEFHGENVDAFGIRYEAWSRPLVARKGTYQLSSAAVSQLLEHHFAVAGRAGPLHMAIAALQAQVGERDAKLKAAGGSRWLLLGRILGLGPKLP